MISYPSTANAGQPEYEPALIPAITSSQELMRGILDDLKGRRQLGPASSSSLVSPPVAWEPNAPFLFGKGLSGNHLLLRGWSYPEADFVWSDGDSAEMLIPGSLTSGASLVKFELRPFCYAPSVIQNVRIRHGERLVGVWDFAAPGSACLILPRSTGNHESIKLVWEFPNARSPREVGLNADPRKLGVAIHAVSLVSVLSLATAPLALN